MCIRDSRASAALVAGEDAEVTARAAARERLEAWESLQRARAREKRVSAMDDPADPGTDPGLRGSRDPKKDLPVAAISAAWLKKWRSWRRGPPPRALTKEGPTASITCAHGNLKPNAQLTVTVTPEIGTLHLHAGGDDVIAVVTASAYPRKLAFALLDEVRVQVTQASITSEDVRNAEKPGCFARALPFLKDACARFGDAAEADKVARVGAQVHEVQAMMEGNINRMLDNQETVGAVEDKSEALREGASQFNRRSEHVRRMMSVSYTHLTLPTKA